MFWDKIAWIYDFFENVYNKSVYTATGAEAARLLGKEDDVLECACGTGAISIHLANACSRLTATDFSENMLKQAEKKLIGLKNVSFQQADITALQFVDSTFDAVVAGNVIHLLPDPALAMKELERVCKKTGRLIIPTYINETGQSSRIAVKFLEALGADFKRQFDNETYRAFFEGMGYKNVEYITVPGRMACCIAVIALDQQ